MHIGYSYMVLQKRLIHEQKFQTLSIQLKSLGILRKICTLFSACIKLPIWNKLITIFSKIMDLQIEMFTNRQAVSSPFQWLTIKGGMGRILVLKIWSHYRFIKLTWLNMEFTRGIKKVETQNFWIINFNL